MQQGQPNIAGVSRMLGKLQEFWCFADRASQYNLSN